MPCQNSKSPFSLSIGQGERAKLASTKKSIIGTWQGKVNGFGDIPAVTLTVKVKNDKLTGTVVFPAVVRTDAGPKVLSKDEWPLIDLKFDGKTLFFKIKVDNPGAVSEWEMKLVSEKEAELRAAGNRGNESRAVKMTKEQ